MGEKKSGKRGWSEKTGLSPRSYEQYKSMRKQCTRVAALKRGELQNQSLVELDMENAFIKDFAESKVSSSAGTGSYGNK